MELEFTISEYVVIMEDFSIVGATRIGVFGFCAITAVASKSFLELTTGSRDTEIGDRGIGEDGRVVRVGVGVERGSGRILEVVQVESIMLLRELGIRLVTDGSFGLFDDIVAIDS